MVSGQLIQWARERAGLDLHTAAKKLGISVDTLKSWEIDGSGATFKQLEKIAHKFYIPLGYLFLDAPPVEELPIADFRSAKNRELRAPSPELLDVIADAQRKQTWLSEMRVQEEQDPVLSIKERQTDGQIIEAIRTYMDLEKLQKTSKNHEEFHASLIGELDRKGFIIIKNSVVGYNNTRKLSLEEFLGFALYDNYAPLIFINNRAPKAGQIFTTIHELVHLFLGESALDRYSRHSIEQRVNKIAGEILVPAEWLQDQDIEENEADIAKQFKVSSFVILIRAKELGIIPSHSFERRWKYFKEKIRPSNRKNRGGNFYSNIKFKSGGEQFLSSVINHTLAGKTLYRDAYSLTGLQAKSFEKYKAQLEEDAKL